MNAHTRPRPAAMRTRGPVPVGVAAGNVVLFLVVLGLAGCSRGSGEAETAARPEAAWGPTAQYDYQPPEPGTYTLPVLGPAAGGRVLTAAGDPRELRDLLRGRVTVLSFIYTRCRDPKACPMASGVLGMIRSVTEQDPRLAKKLQLLTFSFDPDHDTPQVMAEYGAPFAPGGKEGCPWLFLTTKGAQDLKPILDAYGQRVDRKKDPDDPMGPLYHMVRVYLIDGEARIRNIYSFGMLDPRLLLADVRTLLMEETGHRL